MQYDEYSGYGGGGGDAYGGAGGGFSTHSPSHGVGSPSSPSKSGGRPGGGVLQTLTPVTVAQLSHASQAHSEDVFKIDGKELHQVTIVGQILRANIQSTNMNFEVSDGTGSVDVRIWLDADEDSGAAQESPAWREGVYVRIIGQIRSFQEKRSIIAYRILPIENFNELTYHFLESIFVHLYNTKGPLDSGAPSATTTSATGAGGYHDNQYAHQASYSAFNPAAGGLSEPQRMILEVIRACRLTEGANYSYMEQHLRQLPPMEIRRQVEFLSAEGHLYSTIDDEHYKAAD